MDHLADQFREHPGLIYVVATFVPLASFVVLLLAGAVRAAARPGPDGGGNPALFRLLGGDTPTRAGAFVATGAIGLSFVLCLVGFLQHAADLPERERLEAQLRTAPEADHEKIEEQIKEFDKRWKGSRTWADVLPTGLKDRDRGTLLQLGYRIDTLAATMFLMVTFIATLIHLFSIGYMADELQPVVEDHQVHTEDGHFRRRGRFGRFFLFLSLFCFSMLNLILADNLFQVFLSWELVGVCSYLLIGFYYERRSASNAANKAFITNRIGDAGFIIGLLILWTYVGTLNFEDLFRMVRAPLADSHGEPIRLAGHVVRADAVSQDAGVVKLRMNPQGSQVALFPRDEELAHFHKESFNADGTLTVAANPDPEEFGSMPYWLLVAAGLGIFLGCVGKSAQFPLHVWLPDAMEGPTPVSALIHAATMVAAGVYLVGRCFPLFVPESRLVIAYTGGITLFVAATIAIVMTDIKKVLAYSTVSQLGYMMLALGVGGWAAGLFHLITHAFFKALLFLGSGSVIYGCHHEQDMTRMGGLYPKMKITALTMLVGVLTIAGIPLFSGWYSKDAVLAQALGFSLVHPQHFLLFLLPLVTAGITTFYMFRMWFLTFTGTPRDHHVHDHAHESPWLMTLPLVLLAICSVAVAWGWPVWDAEASHLEHHLHHSQHNAVRAEFGNLAFREEHGDLVEYEGAWRGVIATNERNMAQDYHGVAGNLALGLVALGIVFAGLLYYYRVLDPAEAKEQFPGVHRFLEHKWYFDELYSAILVRPALVVAHWCRRFDTRVIDGTVDATARGTVRLARGSGRFDLGVIDGLVNVTARAIFASGNWLRHVQTGYLRSYVLFLVLAAVGIFALLAVALAGRAG